MAPSEDPHISIPHTTDPRRVSFGFQNPRNGSGIIRHQVSHSLVPFKEWKWNYQTPGLTFSCPFHTTHLHLVLKYTQMNHPPRHTLSSGSIHDIRVGQEGPHSGTTEGWTPLHFGGVVTEPKVFPDFFGSEQGHTYGNGLTEESRDP